MTPELSLARHGEGPAPVSFVGYFAVLIAFLYGTLRATRAPARRVAHGIVSGIEGYVLRMRRALYLPAQRAGPEMLGVFRL